MIARWLRLLDQLRPPVRPLLGSLSRRERQWAAGCHYAALLGVLLPMVGNVVGSLLVWQVGRRTSAFVDDQGREAVNFQLTCSLCWAVFEALTWFFLGYPLLWMGGLLALYCILLGGLRANDGQLYRYPLAWRLLRL